MHLHKFYLKNNQPVTLKEFIESSIKIKTETLWLKFV